MSGRNQGGAGAFQIVRPHQQSSAPVPFQFFHVHFLDQASLMNDADAVGEAGHFRQDVAGHEDRHALLAGQFEQELADLHDPGRVQAVGRFIEEQQAGVVQQRLGQSQSLRRCRAKACRFSGLRRGPATGVRSPG